MRKQMQERPGTWRLLIGSVLILCAGMGLATANDLSFSLSDAIDCGRTADGPQELLVRFVDRDGPPLTCSGLFGPRTKRAVRNAICDAVVEGASVRSDFDGAVSGLAVVSLPNHVAAVDAMARFAGSGDVLYAEPNYRYSLCRVSAVQTTLDEAEIDGFATGAVATDGAEVVVAILDTGIDLTHPALAGRLWVNEAEAKGQAGVDDDGNGYVDDIHGYDFINNTADPTDEMYHGSHVAGIIAAIGEELGVSGNVRLMPLKVVGPDGVDLDAAVAAIEYAVAAGARVINISWAGSDYSESLRNAIEAAGEKGVLFVAAAGNGSKDIDVTPVYPAGYRSRNIISVLATDNDGALAWSSNYGRTSVDLGESGQDVLSTLPMQPTAAMREAGLPAQYGVISGSSLAAPRVAGASALLLSQNPSLSALQVKHVLMQTTDRVLPGLAASQGRLNLMAVLTAVPTGQAGRVVNTRDRQNVYSSIQAAIDDANNGDVIIAETLTSGNTVYSERIDFKGKAITLRSGSIDDPNDSNVYPETTFLVGLTGQEGSIVTFANGEGRDSVLRGLTIGWGVAEYGGGVRIEEASPTIDRCIITDNQAQYYGGGIDCFAGSPEIINCVISNNTVLAEDGLGGGINCEDGSPTITHSTIRNNSSMNLGGGVACYNASPTLFNCFVINNSAVSGSAQFDLEDSSPTITNCTIVVDENAPGKGGIVCSGQSDPTIVNCILWGNGDDLVNCFASYSCIEDGDAGEGNIAGDPLLIAGPLGRYYLSQMAAGQLTDSPCLDAGDPNVGSSLASRTTRTDGVEDAGRIDMGAHYDITSANLFPLNLTLMTVDADGAPVDGEVGGTVDPNGGLFREFSVLELTSQPAEGYRLKQWLLTTGQMIDPDATIALPVLGPINMIAIFERIPMYELRITVAGGNGTVSPEHRRGQLYPDGTVIDLVASPASGYIVDAWTGTDNDALWTNANTVTVDSSKEVRVSFRQPKSLHVPGQYRSIGEAVRAASTHGDKIIVGAGIHRVHSIDFGGKAITLASEHPDDPNCVATTILDAAQLGRLFVFQSGEGPDAVVDGFTLRNGSAVYDPETPNDSGGNGAPGEDAFGGAIACFNGSSPTLSNLIIENCVAQGRNGENASAPPTPPAAPDAPADPADPADPLDDPAEPAPSTRDPNAPVDGTPGRDGADGANGADGAPGAGGAPGFEGGRGGNGYGGAFYFDPNCAPTILHVTIRNCRALGGTGGFGGTGQDGQDGQDGGDGQAGQDGQNGGPGINDGLDGNGGNGGNGGSGGSGGPGGAGGAGGKGGDGGEALGGAMYFGANCRPIIRYVTIADCETLQGLGSPGGPGGSGGAGGSGGVGAEGGAAGTGENDGQDGQAGTDGVGADGGAGGAGGEMGINGLRSWAGAIFFAEDCDVQIYDSAISGNSALWTVPTISYAGGNGGAGGAGGSPGGNGGAGGPGGNGEAPGAGGAGGAGGTDGSAGGAGAGGVVLRSFTSNFGGANAYLSNCLVKLTDTTISSNLVEADSGGGEYYANDCEVELTRCTIEGNTSGLYGGGQAFEVGCSITANGCSYFDNEAGTNGGGLFLSYECRLDVNDSTFSGNRTADDNGYGGGLFGGGIWDEDRLDYYNASTLNIRGSQFLGNEAGYGGGLYWYGQGADVRISNGVIRGNTAIEGGGLYWSRGAPVIENCSIRGNQATGPQYTVYVPAPALDPNDPSTWPPSSTWPDPNDPNSMFDPNNPFTPPDVPESRSTGLGLGGGLVCWSSNALIQNCFISENTTLGSGGGVYFGGDPYTPRLKNCLIKANSATVDGGGIASHWYAAPTIENCTIVENRAFDTGVPNRGKGGGLVCSHSSNTVLINSILWNNEAQQGSQISIGSDSDPVYIQRPATLTVSYSNVQYGRLGLHIESGRTLNWLAGNIESDPLFVDSYFLSQIAAGQSQDSPSVNAGSALATQLGLADATTRTDGVGDAGTVDMGFHYAGQGRYRLEVAVVGGHGTVTPTSGYYHEFAQVTLVATPQPGYRVRQWIGTDDDPSWNRNTNVVTMDPGDKFITVQFERDVTRNIIVPDEFRTIEEAVLAASPGDTNIILKEGVHYVSTATGIDLQRKAVRIMSTDPNDPNIIATTIIDCGGSRFVRRRAFHFQRGEGPDTLITGVTIRNGYWIGAVGVTGGIPARPILEYNPDEDDPPILMASGTSVSGTGYGGAILCENGSSPTFRNVIIEDCMVVAAQGGNGVDGIPITSPNSDRKGDWGGHAGSGSGNSFGGAIACLGGSKPTFVNVTIRNCMARGGMGGDAGSGSNPNQGSGWASWGGNAGSASGDGHGGAVYCEAGSDAVFQNCVFANNHATSGIAGLPGAAGPGSDLSDPYPNPAGPGASGMVSTNGTIVGGAVYQNGASPTFVDCTFTGNMAYNAISLDPTLALLGLEQEELYTYMPGGGIYSGPGNTVKLERCEFSRNISSAVYVDASCIVDFNDCVFSHNQANGQSAGVGSYSIMIDGVIIFRQDFNLSNVLVDYSGGALFVGPLCPEVTLRNCQFYSNSASASGGAVRLMSDADIVGCSFSGNKAGGNGGALEGYLDSGNPQQPATLNFALQSCSFGGNSAVDGFYGQGGAIHFEDFEAVFSDCYFLGNRAKNGGALYLTAGNAKFIGGIISNNESTGGSGIDTQTAQLGAIAAEQGAGVDIGGGLVCAATSVTIEDYTFENNTAGGAKGAGGAITFYGGYVDHVVKNCLFLDNNANRHGGAVWAGLFATPSITNSTFVGNDARRLGGAVFCDWDGDVTMTDCIFQDNSKVAVVEVDFANSTLTHSLFHENPDGDFGVYDATTATVQTMVGAELDVTNIGADPLFVEGPLGKVYLSQAASGQEATSPAVDAGSRLAESLGLSELTTRTDGSGDEGAVDLGFHFRDHTTLEQFTLTTRVVGGHGTLEPATGRYYAGTAVPLTARPESGWRVAQWAGTTDDASKSVNNLVVMGPDRTVTVEFDQPRTIIVGSAPEYTSIQHAIDAAGEGDVVVVPAGTYAPVFPWPYIEISNKNITLMGSNPDDPNVVASTIMRQYQFMISNVGPETIIEGITFRDTNIVGTSPGNTSQAADDGPDGVSVSGSALYITNASPTIRNCNFVDCSVTGGNGAPGDGGTEEHPMGFDGGWAGYAYGGAAYIGYLSSPTFENCTFSGCFAQGGNGGDGGGGVQGAQGGRGGNWEWAQTIENLMILSGWDGWMYGPYLDYWKYSGFGGAVYIEYYSAPKFVDCTFENNYTAGGVCGVGGNPVPPPQTNQNIENFGGAVYIGSNSSPVFEGCIFRDNIADTNTVAVPDDIYVSYGGAIAFEDGSTPTFIRCILENNTSCVGGGMWWSNASATIVDCNFVGNSAYHGGGMYAVDAVGVIDGSVVQRNLAFLSSVNADLVTDPNVGFGGVMSWGGGFAGINSPIDIYNSIFAGNRSLSSGGGIYLGGSDQDITTAPRVHNSLITGNTAGRDGGGISIWKSEPIISSSTIADNVVTGALGSAFGGGLFVAYDSNAVLTDSIVWGNSSNKNGSQVAVANGFQYGARPSTLHVRHSNIQPSLDPASVAGVPLDLVFVIDTTDSMTNNVLALRAAAAQLVATVAMQSPDYRMAVVDFKDFNETGLGATTDYTFRTVVPFTEDPTRVVNGINTLGTPAGAGGDTDAESVYSALIDTIDGTALGGWRGGQVNRIILLIGDGPPHDPEPPTGYTLSTVVNAASQSPSKRIFAVQIGQDPLTSVYYTSLAGGTGGALTRASNALGLAAAVTQSIGLITHVAPSIYVSDQSRLPGWDAAEATWDEATGNIDEDPLFIAGYYLGQTASGQGRQSPAVDAGSGPANAVGIDLAGRTTRTDGVPDANTVDMGYHYVQGVTLFTLTAEVLPNADDGLPHGSVTPAFAVAYEGAADNVVRLVATPEQGWRVSRWSGTDDDTLTGLTNTVTLTQDRQVTVTFEKRRSRVVTVPGDYSTIQGAVTAAGEGDTIVVDPGTYYSGYEAFALIIDKPVTITSRNPDDPTVVASTIIDGLGAVPGNAWNNIGVLFGPGADRNTVFNGFTIQNCGGNAADGDDGDRDIGHPNGGDGAPIEGAAMILLPGAAPVIKNCIFRNNAVIAGDGGAGVDADDTTNAGRGGWGGWARGGAIYCAVGTNPRFVNCIIENNFVQGGNGGNGGNYSDGGGLANYGGNYTPPVMIDINPNSLGAETATQELWRTWLWDFAADVESAFGTQPYSPATGIIGSGGSYFGDYRWYSGYGGGVYIDQRSSAEFISCVIRGNRSYGGMSGQGGQASAAGRFTEPLIPFQMPSYGGGVYCAAETTVIFTGCTFEDNIASPTAAGQDPNFRLDPYIGFGGGIAAEGTANLTFVDCNFVDNSADTGGGIYVINAGVSVIDCNVTQNTALRGAGLAGMGGSIGVAGSRIWNNWAITDQDDPNDNDIAPIGGGLLLSSADALVEDCDIAGNISDGSGGGIYLRGQNATQIVNCLIRNNRAYRDGGGISTNWYAEPTIRNCTFVTNAAPGAPSDPNNTGFGGAIFCGYLSEATVIDSILWGNGARLGGELAVGSGYDLDPLCGTLRVSYSNIRVGPNDVWVDTGCTLAYGEGIINADPIFVSGMLGDFYLSNRSAGQSRTSPAVNAGSDLAGNVGMARSTTRTDHVPDTGRVDMGYHYPFIEPCKFCDLVFDGIIDFKDFAAFASQWLDEGCSETNGWCDQADVTFDSRVNVRDLTVLADCWLVQDTTPPAPDPAEWETLPRLDGSTARMVAKEAVDAWGWPVEYYFENVSGGGHDSGWQSSRVYNDTGLSSGRQYGYRVKARDALGNETKFSAVRYAGTVDRMPPVPEPYILPNAVVTSQTITLIATEAFDDNGVQYFFDTNTPGANDSGWINTNTYTDANLAPGVTYCYRVKARDMSANQNETPYSAWSCFTTAIPADPTPPTPNPMAFDPNGLPREYSDTGVWNDYWVEMMAVTATDDSGGVEYYFQCREPSGFSSGWQADPIYRVQIGRQNQGLQFRVRARDAEGNLTGWSDWVMAIARPNQPALGADDAAGGGAAQ